MAIAFDAASGGTRFASTGTSHSWSHTFSGTDRFASVQVGSYRATGGGDVVTGVTIDGVSCTLDNKDDVQPNTHYYNFYLVAPSSGTVTIEVSYASTNYVWATCASYTGVDQSSPIDSSGIDSSGANTRNSITSTTTVVASDCWLIGGMFANAGGVSAGTGTIVRTTSPTDARLASVDSNGTVPTGSQSLNVTCTNNPTSWGVISIKPAGGGGGPTANNSARRLLLMDM